MPRFCLALEAFIARFSDSDIVMKRRGLLPSTVPPLHALESQYDHWNQKHNMNQGERQPCILKLDLFTQGDAANTREYVSAKESNSRK